MNRLLGIHLSFITRSIMTKNIKMGFSIFIIAVLVIVSFSACKGRADNHRSLIEDQMSSSEQVQTVYMKFLKDLYKKENSKDALDFALKDLDHNGIQELILARNGVDITVYTFSGSLTEIGKHNFVTGTTRLLFSDNPSYPGILYFLVSGGLEQYGYLSVKNNQLTDEALWNEDYSGIFHESRDKIKEFSTDKQLINESRIAYKENHDIKFSPLASIA